VSVRVVVGGGGGGSGSGSGAGSGSGTGSRGGCGRGAGSSRRVVVGAASRGAGAGLVEAAGGCGLVVRGESAEREGAWAAAEGAVGEASPDGGAPAGPAGAVVTPPPRRLARAGSSGRAVESAGTSVPRMLNAVVVSTWVSVRGATVLTPRSSDQPSALPSSTTSYSSVRSSRSLFLVQPSRRETVNNARRKWSLMVKWFPRVDMGRAGSMPKIETFLRLMRLLRRDRKAERFSVAAVDSRDPLPGRRPGADEAGPVRRGVERRCAEAW
jgi:hypothetical protein